MRFRRSERKIIAIVLAAAMAGMLLQGCGQTAEEENTAETAAAGDSGAEAESDGTGTENVDTGDTENGEAADIDTSGRNMIEQTYFPDLPDSEETSSIFVQKIDGLSDDFIKGMDISSLLAEEASGVKYYDADGKEQDLLKLLADAGINCIRVRVWVDPYDSEGHGYGGGNCTAETAAELGSRAAAYGIDTCVDFHYSDFWADPNKQMVPKSWKGLDVDERAQALYDYTVESLQTILNAGANVTMVQIGNEINPGMSGEKFFSDVAKLLKSGSKAVRDISAAYDSDIKVVAHYTKIDDAQGTMDLAGRLADNDIDIDVFGVSYYPYWHGTMENMQQVLTDIHDTYGYETCIMETAYPYTAEDGDESGNSVSAGTDDYPVSVQGQASSMRDVCAYASAAGALGVFYWEGAWIPVQPESGTRSELWEKEGSGWASSYAAEYDPDDAGKYYGGSSWDNQAFFDFDGNELDSLNVFKYLKYGSVGEELEVIGINDLELNFAPGAGVTMPDTFPVKYNDPSCTEELEVEWDTADVAAIDPDATGVYEVDGTIKAHSGLAVSDDIQVSADGTIPVKAEVNVANSNLIANSSFEESDYSMWTVTPITGKNPSDYQNKTGDAKTGDISFHFWSSDDMEFTVEQEITAETSGTYGADCFMQGDDFGSDDDVHLYIKVGDTEYDSDSVDLDGWIDWKHPEVTGAKVNAGDKVIVGAYVRARGGAWATFDDFTLCLE